MTVWTARSFFGVYVFEHKCLEVNEANIMAEAAPEPKQLQEIPNARG